MDSDSSDAAISVYRDGPDGVLALRGRFHVDLARDLHQAALQLAESGGGVIVDCSQTEHLDGCALQVLMALKLALEHGGGWLRMRGESAEVRKYLAWGGLSAHFPAPAAAAAPTRKRRKTARKSSL